MTVGASSTNRSLAELATGAVDDDARQDENHAGDAEDVSQMLRADAVMAGVPAREEVSHDVEATGPDHRHQPEPAHAWHATQVAPHSPLYR